MSIIRVNTIQLNQEGNATIAIANSYNVSIATDGAEKFKVDSSGTIIRQNLTVAGNVRTSMVVTDHPLMFRNRLINGDMGIDQRNAGASQTFTNTGSGGGLTYSVDRWFAWCSGANVTGQRVAGLVTNNFRYRFTGAASVTAINFGQRIEAVNCADLAGGSATLSVDLANSLLTTVTWAAYYANTTDTFGTVASPTKTLIATGTFTVSSTVSRYSATFAVPAAATTGIEILFSVGAQTSGTWTIGDVQLEEGGLATPYEKKPIGFELAQCQRYYFTIDSTNLIFRVFNYGASAYSVYIGYNLPVTMRVVPTISNAQGDINDGTVKNFDFVQAFNAQSVFFRMDSVPTLQSVDLQRFNANSEL